VVLEDELLVDALEALVAVRTLLAQIVNLVKTGVFLLEEVLHV